MRNVLILVGAALLAAACAKTSTLEVTYTETRSESVSPLQPAASGGDATPGGTELDGSTTDEVADGGNRLGPTTGGPTGPTTSVAQRSGGPVDTSPIRLGVLSTLSGGEKFVGEPPYRIALAYAERLNAAGGINGRKLEILGYDVCGRCPDEGLAQAIKAVERDGVFALVNTFVVSAALDQAAVYLEDNGVPMVQGASGEQARDPAFGPYTFSIGATVPGRAAIGADFAKAYLEEKGLPPKVALLYFTDPLTSLIAEEQRKAIERVGLEIVDEEPVSYDATMTNQSSQVIKMRAAGAEMVIGAHGVLCAFNMQAAEQNGWDAPYLCTIMYDPFTTDIAGPNAIEGRDVFADTEGYATMDLPGEGVADFKSLMADYYPDGDIGLVTLYSYLGMRVVEEGIRSMGDEVTRDGLAAYLEGLTNYDAGGLTAPFTLGPDDHGGIDAAHIVKLNPDRTFERLTDHWTYPAAIHGLPGPNG